MPWVRVPSLRPTKKPPFLAVFLFSESIGLETGFISNKASACFGQILRSAACGGRSKQNLAQRSKFCDRRSKKFRAPQEATKPKMPWVRVPSLRPKRKCPSFCDGCFVFADGIGNRSHPPPRPTNNIYRKPPFTKRERRCFYTNARLLAIS